MKKWKKSCRILEDKSDTINTITYIHYLDMLTDLAINTFDWINMPPEIDTRFLELQLFKTGMAIFYKDDIADQYVGLSTMVSAPLTIYNVPKIRKAYATNDYRYDLDSANSVLIFNNYLRNPTFPTICYYAEKISQIERIIDVNLNGQKHPLMIICDENQRLTIKNLYQQYNGNEPVIFGNKSIDVSQIQALKTDSPYICDKLFALKRQYINEALTALGIENTNTEKGERLITDEVISNLGQTQAERYTKLNARKQACKEINEMFGLDIDVEFRKDLMGSEIRNNLFDSGAMPGEQVHDRAEISYREGD